MTNFWRGCAGCGAHLLTGDGSTIDLFCKRCHPRHVTPFDEWAAGLAVGSRVYLQPYLAWRGLWRSEHVVTARDGDTLTVQIVGIPESRQDVLVSQCGQHKLGRSRHVGALG